MPDEVTETENQDSHTGELDGIGEGAVECYDVVSEHRCEGEWAKTLHEGDKARRDER